MSRNILKVINLGKRSFGDGLRTQEIMRQRVMGTTGPCSLLDSVDKDTVRSHHAREPEHVLLLVEHWPVYTAGLRDKALSADDENRLKGLGADVFRTNRGGLATFHGPGQLVAYPIINLKHYGFGLKEYVKRLELTLVDTCRLFGVDAHCSRETGVWVEDRKIASVGVNAKRYVTLHGVALNCCTDLSWFKHITPCGLEGVEMTSLTKETGNIVDVSSAEWQFLKSFAKNFDSDLHTGSDYVPATVLVDADAQDKKQHHLVM